MIYTFRPVEKGDTISVVGFQLVINSLPKDLTGVTIEAIFYSYSYTEYMAVSITNAATGSFQIDQQVIDWRKGQWRFEMKFTFPNGSIKTYLKGSILITD